MSDYLSYYVESTIICLVIFGIMLGNDFMNTDRQEKQIKYDRALVAFMAYYVSDVFWAAVRDGAIPRSLFSVALTNFANAVLMAAITYAWLEYVLAVEEVPNRNKKSSKITMVLPFVVSTIALLCTFLFAPQVLVDDKYMVTPVYSVFQLAVPFIYIGAIVVYTIRKARVEENPIEKKRQLFIGCFPLMVIFCGLTQIVLLPDIPVFCFSSTIFMLVLYVQSMNNRVSKDSLTGLNNRGQLVRYVSQKSNIHIEGRRTFVIMIDVNDFKKVNDTYGHAEGDRALMIVADSLKDVIRRHDMPVFLGRYGGDEFVIVAHPAGEEEIEPLITEIRSRIEEKCGDYHAPYVLSVGIGYDELLENNDSFQKCIQRADDKLYLDKDYRKTGGKSTVIDK